MTDHMERAQLGAIRHALEPIVELDAGHILSFEVCSFSESRALLDQSYFGDVEQYPMVSLLTRQLAFFQKLNKHDPQLYRAAFVNVPPSLFEHWLSWQDFVPFILQFRLSIGCDTASLVDGMSAPALGRLLQLKELGVTLWLNNADDALYKVPADILHAFSGIKINKRFFWQCFNRNDAAFMEHAFTVWGNKSVIVEGVENRHHLSFVRARGLVQGQGFHWRAKLSRHAHWH
ncbi:EAL domain-containing protein [Aeromonas aquatica]|uniref:EAL domain-containing protein n=1 Tax=Aeromonas aquatica TaxID=558964 RepID=UPI00286EE029|nr:EAL domain-containing protein [Aeromonas aquatica]